DRMSRMKSDFLANISHEMRTPLAVMAGYAGLTSLQLQKGSIDDGTLQNLTTIKREAIRLAELVEQIKDVSLEKDRRLSLQDIGAYTILRQTAEFCALICTKNRNSLVVAADTDEGLTLHVNAESIFQILVNLVVNANRHTKEGSIILGAHTTESPGFAELFVIDSGSGLDAQVLPRLFERGFSGDGGSGLGLSICKEIVEEHGGTIRIESEPGKGVGVHFTLPCAKGETEHV
ncbi:MAG: HAMP domain-containing sensor histidine kinase, partial [Bacillota bacterium]